MTIVATVSSPARALRIAAGIILVGLLVVAPLNYGSTRPGPLFVLASGTAVAGFLWLLAGIMGRSFVLPPKAGVIGATLIGAVALAWLVLLSPAGMPYFTTKHFARVLARWPNSVITNETMLSTLWPCAAALALFVLHDLTRERSWRLAVAAALTITGLLIAILGLIQNATHARGIYWDASVRMPGAFFGTFFHHTSAGAYLNTVWPVALALAVAGLRGTSRICRIGGISATVALFVLLAAHTGHVSRFPQVIAAVLLCILLLWIRPWRIERDLRMLRFAAVAAVIALPVGLFAMGGDRIGDIRARWSLLQWSRLIGEGRQVDPVPPERWNRLMRDDLFIPSDHRGYPLGDRGAAYATALAAVADRPWLGWGPGGWMTAAASHSVDPFIRTFFLYLQFTHQDYLQTVVEWGLIGAVGWALLIPGALFFALHRIGFNPAADLIAAGAVVALAAVLIQSFIDFPLRIPAVQFNAVALAALAWSTLSQDRAPTDFS